jgi:hypothetical protein
MDPMVGQLRARAEASQRVDARGIYRRVDGVVYNNAGTGTSVSVGAGSHVMAVSDLLVQRGRRVFGSTISASSTDYGSLFIRPFTTDNKALTIQTLPSQTDSAIRVFDDINTTLFPVQADGKMLAAGGIGVGNRATASTPGTAVNKIQVFNNSANSLGYTPAYDAIT